MRLYLKKSLCIFTLGLLAILWFSSSLNNFVEAAPPEFNKDFTDHLGDYVINPDKYQVTSEQNFRKNIINLFYPSVYGPNSIYTIIRGATLWIMILFIVWIWASLLINNKPEESKKRLTSLLYILLWWVFVYGANRLFWEVLHFNSDQFTIWQDQGIEWVKEAFIWKEWVLFVILSAVKAFAFFLAIIMIVLTWFKVMAAWEWEKWKKLVKWIINVVVALLIIKWVDYIYYVAANSSTFVENASNFIINVAKLFGYIYWVVSVIMVIVAWYLYITDGWSGSNFKKASNILINILLSALVLFAFLLIVYQIFAEFQTWWDAVSDTIGEIATLLPNNYG